MGISGRRADYMKRSTHVNGGRSTRAITAPSIGARAGVLRGFLCDADPILRVA